MSDNERGPYDQDLDLLWTHLRDMLRYYHTDHSNTREVTNTHLGRLEEMAVVFLNQHRSDTRLAAALIEAFLNASWEASVFLEQDGDSQSRVKWPWLSRLLAS